METKTFAILGIVAALAAVIAPSLVSAAFAASLTTCNDSAGPCPGNSGSNGNNNKCETTYTGNSVNSKQKSSGC